ncbi:hypothetical protein CDL15_Pgr028539 [Punica granatum]|uniref:Protein kinase domain-containing protein n=1 Tax=Punica granatum TaxID=22663 RepID=A0A218VY69_PUNGR|nr:hypothetical protein CDL15_Pgr028539 [Punica granatum]PKI58647.1 hypothetical protein CRG98_020973 [Punica granatum]
MTPGPSQRSLSSRWRILAFSLVLLSPLGLALNSDGVLLLSFKYAILSDPLSVLNSWNYEDVSPCSWTGVTCTQIGSSRTPDMFRVTGLVLPNSKLLGSIPPELGQIEHLTILDLSNNLFNGSLPDTIFNSSSLQVLSLSNNVISGELKATIDELKSLKLLNLSDNALAGKIPETISTLPNLTVVSLTSNYFSGNVPGGFGSVKILDLSSNLLNGSLPSDFGGSELRYLNISYNKISGPIPKEFGSHIPRNTTVDLSFNNLSGAVPESLTWMDQKTAFLAGNSDLCGKPLKILCSIPSTLTTPPNASSTSPAIAVIPKPINSSSDPSMSSPAAASVPNNQTGHGLKPGTIVGVVMGNLAGIGILALVILYVYQLRKRKALVASDQKPNNLEKKSVSEVVVTSQHEEPRKTGTSACSCLTMKAEETSEATSTSESDQEEDKHVTVNDQVNGNAAHKVGSLVTVDGETELELDTLLKASAYILGASGGSIVYKAVLENGAAYAVRRIGESGVERLKDFESQVRAIAKLKHPNLVRVRGFYWGDDEKLVIYDYVPNGSLSSAGYRKGASSPFNLSFETRLKIVRGVARGLAYIHEKKQVHGNIKPSNILLSSDTEPVISDLGLYRLIIGNQSLKLGTGSTRQFGSQRFNSTIREGHHDSPSPYTPIGSATSGTVSPYQAPESLKNVKPNAKWDVYSYGIVLLELLTGRIFMDPELTQWAATVSSTATEDRDRALRIIDAALRADMAAREEATMACLKLGFSCASLVPQKRPSMKEAIQVLEKLP